MIDRATIDRIFSAADIVEVVGEYVNLKKAGINYKGLSPFTNEKTPSFFVSPAKGIFKCFSSGKGGSAVTFLMEHEKLSYPEALKYLAKKYNIEYSEKEESEEERQQKDDRESMLAVNVYAQKYFSDTLFKTEEGKAIGLSYFHERGFREDTILKFQLGYSREQKDAFSKTATDKGYKIDFLVKTGLTIQKDNHLYDRFHGRVMFPIHSLSGQVIGFGGRILKTNEKTAKYLNSPESEIYHKGHTLYGFYFARQSVIKHDKCFLVEGYTDVISMHQAGIDNVAASSGTSLTSEQIRLIKRFTKNVTVLYDGDEAGIKASLRGIDMILEEGLNVRVVLLPDGEDPDSFARSRSASDFLDFIEKNETDFISFKTRLLIKDAKSDPVKRATLITDVVRSVAVIPDGITRTVYIRECSKILDIDERVLYTEIRKIRRRLVEQNSKYSTTADNLPDLSQSNIDAAKVKPNEQNDTYLVEKEIIRLLLNYGNKEEMKVKDKEKEEITISVAKYVINEIDILDKLEFKVPIFDIIYNEIRRQFEETGKIDDNFFIMHHDVEIASTSVDLLTVIYQLSRIWSKQGSYVQTEDMILKEIVPGTVAALKNQNVKSKITETEKELKAAQETNDMEKMMLLQQRRMILDSLKKELSKNLGGRVII